MEDEIEEASEKYMKSDELRYFQEICDYDVRDAFIAGAKWSLSNQWHDASKELPGDGIKVIVLTEKGNAAINSVYTFNGNRRWHSNYAVLFWMPIPSLPKELK